MIINQANMNEIYVGFSTVFNKAFDEAKPFYEKIATTIESKTKSEKYTWLGQMPRMIEWIGERTVKNLALHDYEIKNKSWELTISLDRNDVEDDSIGIYANLIQAMGESAKTHPDEIIFSLIKNGFINKCYDGKPFFSSVHQEEKSIIQNNMGIYKLNIDTYADARASMISIKDESGNPFKVTPNLLVVPPQLEGIARQILLADKVEGTTNMFKNSAELLVVPELSDNPTKWFLFDTSKPIRPLIFQQRKKTEFVSKDDIKDDNVFNKKEFLYGADSRDNAGYGLWQLAYGSTGEVEM